MCGVKGACSGAKNFTGVSYCGCRGVEIGIRGLPWEKGAGEGGSPVLSLPVTHPLGRRVSDVKSAL